MEDSRYRLRILHLSDLHERGPREAEPWRRRRTLGDAWDRNLAELLQDGPVDLVCFSGDAADWGLPEEYEAATGFFEAILERLHVSRDRLFLVPGNHDINRKIESDAWQSLRMVLSAGVDSLAFSRWMNGRGAAPPGVEQSWRDRLLEREAAYRKWLRETLKRPELAPDGLGYGVTLQLPGWTFPIHILGLDTAWLCGDDSDAGRLHLTENQLMGLATREDGSALGGLRLMPTQASIARLRRGAVRRAGPPVGRSFHQRPRNTRRPPRPGHGLRLACLPHTGVPERGRAARGNQGGFPAHRRSAVPAPTLRLIAGDAIERQESPARRPGRRAGD